MTGRSRVNWPTMSRIANSATPNVNLWEPAVGQLIRPVIFGGGATQITCFHEAP